ncbi:MAG: ATP-binding protein [Erysipelotrichaceae bacterium]|nr:ATP-binding protein [Erysipelotrichaceae bacterium]
MHSFLDLLGNKIILVGEAGCGKSELTLQLAYFYRAINDHVTIIDLDVINPYYRSREYVHQLNADGIKVTGSYNIEALNSDLPMINTGSFKVADDEAIIVDLAGSIAGLKIVNAMNIEYESFSVVYVLNSYRNLTNTIEKMVDSIQSFERILNHKVSFVLNNSHLLHDTEWIDLQDKKKLIQTCCNQLGAKLIVSTVGKEYAPKIEDRDDSEWFVINRIMNRHSW